jgi:hypothetical protein
MAVMTSTTTAAKVTAGVRLALRKASGQAGVLHPHLAPHTVVFLIVGAAVVLYLAAYRISLWLHPYRLCRRCGGSGKLGGGLLSWGWSYCGRCGSRGLVPRLGTVVLETCGAGRRARW